MHRKSKPAKKHNKLTIHATCIGIGTVLSVAITFFSPAMVHIAVILPALPSLGQEILDKLFNL
jgi:hypothetical protein